MTSTLKEQLIKLYPSSVLNPSFSKTDFVKLDLSINNEDLKNLDISSSEKLNTYINNLKDKNSAKVAYGGYLEKRAIYDRSNHFNTENEKTQRNIHLGLDLWLEAGSRIYAPIDGKVHSFRNNKNFGDYGPTLILEHELENQKFYTLYGHLSLESIQNIKIDQQYLKGQKIATLGDSKVNGDYGPHLHFQIIEDLQNNNGDYPGVCSEKDLEFYQFNCPDPKIILDI